MRRCNQFPTRTVNLTSDESNVAENEVAVMNGVAIIPIVTKPFCEDEQLGGLRLGLRVVPTGEVTPCRVLQAEEPESWAMEDRTSRICDTHTESDE